jgi:hypothetical protein
MKRHLWSLLVPRHLLKKEGKDGNYDMDIVFVLGVWLLLISWGIFLAALVCFGFNDGKKLDLSGFGGNRMIRTSIT